MKVLFLTARFPYPPHRGDRLNAYHLLRALSTRHEVTLASFVDGSETAEARSELEKLCGRIETVSLSRQQSWRQAWLGIVSPVPGQVSYYRSSEMTRRVRSLLAAERWDVIYVQLFRMSPFVREVEHPAKVLFLTDSMALALQRQGKHQPWWKQGGLAWERMRVARFEIEATRWFRESWVVSPVDARDLESRGAHALRVVTHGVDERLFALPIRPRTGSRVLFLGNLGVPHNVDGARYLVRDVWPRIHSAVPGAELVLAGADPSADVRAFASLPGVQVTGTIPDVIPLWEQAALLLAPLRHATGIQNKILEAMAAGVPVVTTPPAADGIEARDGEHVCVRADSEGLAAAAIGLLRAPQSATERCQRARTFVRERFSWEAQVRRLEILAAEPRSEALSAAR